MIFKDTEAHKNNIGLKIVLHPKTNYVFLTCSEKNIAKYH